MCVLSHLNMKFEEVTSHFVRIKSKFTSKVGQSTRFSSQNFLKSCGQDQNHMKKETATLYEKVCYT